MTLLPGSPLGPYQIVSSLGAGGMGEVYRACDTRLKRDVALKVLPTGLAAAPERLARFQREAEVLASLNHPHIAHLHGLEEFQSTGSGQDGWATALVMELVEGEDLAQRIARGPIPLEDALPIALQIADALEVAHEHGIIHRDLKPANIKVRDDGTVKVLDFGLAKALDPSGSNPDLMNSPTMASPATQMGMIVGTAAYMSPEQARGARSIAAPMCGRSGPCSTRCSPADARSRVTMSRSRVVRESETLTAVLPCQVASDGGRASLRSRCPASVVR